jgi:hypothetical protein
MTRALVAAAFLLAPLAGQQPDPWAPLRSLEGAWAGDSKGKPGVGKAERTYQFILNGKFLHSKHQGVYPKETHEDWGLISYDRDRKAFVLRQFHVEGFVNQYVWTPADSTTGNIVFTSEAIENIPAGWRARETYKLISRDEFTETFELAGPGKEFAVYSQVRLPRVTGVR